MGRVYLKFDGKKWHEVDKSDFWIDRALLTRLNNLKMIQKEKWDGVFLIDGMERSGKSTLGIISGWYLSDCRLTEKNFARGLSDAAKKITDAEEGSVIIMDEGSTIFSSKDSSNTAQKKLIKILDVVGQKNLFFIIVLPCFFDLNKTIAVRRSKFLLHVYPDKLTYKRGKYVCWGEVVKGKLYRIGKKNFDSYAYPKPSDEPGEYFDFRPPFYEKYLKEVKAETLKEVLEDAQEKKKVDKETMKVYLWKVKVAGLLNQKVNQFTIKDIAEILEESPRTVERWIQVYKRTKEEQIYEKIGGLEATYTQSLVIEETIK